VTTCYQIRFIREITLDSFDYSYQPGQLKCHASEDQEGQNQDLNRLWRHAVDLEAMIKPTRLWGGGGANIAGGCSKDVLSRIYSASVVFDQLFVPNTKWLHRLQTFVNFFILENLVAL